MGSHGARRRERPCDDRHATSPPSPGIPLIQVGASQCVGGQTVATLTQVQFSNDQKAEVAANPLTLACPGPRERRRRGDARSSPTVRRRRSTAAGCGPLLINPGQTGYFRTLYYTAQQLQALQGAFPKLAPVDQYGLLQRPAGAVVRRLSADGRGLDLVGRSPGRLPMPRSSSRRSALWSGLYDDLERDKATQAAIAARVSRAYGPRLQQLGFAPAPGRTADGRAPPPTLIGTLGKMRDPAVVAEAKRLFAAWQSNPNAIPGSLKQTWLGVIARNADAATWDALHAKAQGGDRRGRAHVAVPAARRHEGRSPGAPRARPRAHQRTGQDDQRGHHHARSPAGIQRMAVDFVLAHLDQVNQLIDISGRSRFMQRLVGGSSDAS